MIYKTASETGYNDQGSDYGASLIRSDINIDYWKEFYPELSWEGDNVVSTMSQNLWLSESSKAVHVTTFLQSFREPYSWRTPLHSDESDYAKSGVVLTAALQGKRISSFVRSHPNGTMIKTPAMDANEYWLIKENTCQLHSFNYAVNDPIAARGVVLVSEAEFNWYSRNSAIIMTFDYDLRKSPSSPRIYWVKNGKRCHVFNESVFESWFGEEGWTKVRLDSAVESLPIGETITYRDGTLLKGSASTVYVVENGLRRPLQNENVFLSLGYRWSDVVTVPDSELASASAKNVLGVGPTFGEAEMMAYPKADNISPDLSVAVAATPSSKFMSANSKTVSTSYMLEATLSDDSAGSVYVDFYWSSDNWESAWRITSESIGVQVLPGVQYPVAHVWSSAPAGAFQVRAVARDDAGNVRAVYSVPIEDGSANDITPPAVAVISPDDSSSYTVGGSAGISWMATDGSGAIDRVDIAFRRSPSDPWIDIAIGYTSGSPYTWTPIPAPSSSACQVRVRAYDASGNRGEAISGGYFNILTDYSLSGHLRYPNSDPIVDGSVVIQKADTGTYLHTVVPTDASGRFVAMGIPEGAYRLVPVKEGLAFTPARVEPVSVSATSPNPVVNFTGIPVYTVSGVCTLSGAPLELAKVRLDEEEFYTGQDGTFTFYDVSPGTYTLRASKAGLAFLPAQASITVSSANVLQDFNASEAFAILGTIEAENGAGIEGVTLQLQSGETSQSSQGGAYGFESLAAGSCVLTPTHAIPRYPPW